MKKIVKTISIITLLFTLGGCGNSNTKNQSKQLEKPKEKVEIKNVSEKETEADKNYVNHCKEIENEIGLNNLEITNVINKNDKDYIMYSVFGNDLVINQKDKLINIIKSKDKEHKHIELAIINSESKCIYDKEI